jgi:hypothetical protein
MLLRLPVAPTLKDRYAAPSSELKSPVAPRPHARLRRASGENNPAERGVLFRVCYGIRRESPTSESHFYFHCKGKGSKTEAAVPCSLTAKRTLCASCSVYLQSVENEGVAEPTDFDPQGPRFQSDEISYQIWPF